MIYLFVGTDPKGFDRLVSLVDSLCSKKKINCLAQIGNGKYLPKYIKYKRFISLKKHLLNIKKSRFVIAHGGFGIISECINQKRPFLIFPRNRNEHSGHDQKLSIKNLGKKIKLNVCYSEKKLKIKIIKFNNTKKFKTITLPKSNIPKIIKDFINKNYL